MNTVDELRDQDAERQKPPDTEKPAVQEDAPEEQFPAGCIQGIDDRYSW